MQNKSNKKICKKCLWTKVIKYWKFRWKQRYLCKYCNTTFENEKRIWNLWKKIFNDYVFWKQTYLQLKEKYCKSIKSIQKIIDEYVLTPWYQEISSIVLLIDTTYFWNFWIMWFKDYESKNILKVKIVKNETNDDYKNWIRELQKEWWIIKAIVCDWKKWLLWWFWDIPTQMCNFHQSKIVQRYLTKRPNTKPNIDLMKISKLLTITDRETFEYELDKWYKKYENFLKERSLVSWEIRFTHRKTRSAYFSLKNNLKYLFIWYDYIWIVDIPNTTNWLEWFFGHIKAKVSLHRWLKKERKIKLIMALFYKKI